MVDLNNQLFLKTKRHEIMNLIERNKELIKKFETMINTADIELAKELVDDNAPFYTPASPKPLYGGAGYLSVVNWMRQGFSDCKWHIKDLVADKDKVAVYWELSGTHDGKFMDIEATGKKISVCVMNFYYINSKGKITNDIAAAGMIGILRGIGAMK